jgi:hypothetical protein
MDSSSSSWFSWMTQSTIHKRNVARRMRTVQHRTDNRPTLLRIASVLTAEQPRSSHQRITTQKVKSIGKDDTFSADEIMFNAIFDDESRVLVFDRSVSTPVALSMTPKTGLPMSVTMAGILGSWMAARYTNALSRLYHTSSPMGHAILAPHKAPHLGMPISVVCHFTEGLVSNHVKWNKLASLLLRTMQSSWKSSNKTRIPLVVVLLAGYEVLTSAVLGPR